MGLTAMYVHPQIMLAEQSHNHQVKTTGMFSACISKQYEGNG